MKSLWSCLLAGWLVVFSGLAVSSSGEDFVDPLQHRITLIKSRLMMTREHQAIFPDQAINQSSAVAATRLIDAMQFSLCPLDDAREQIRLHRIETFGIFLRLIAMSEEVSLDIPEQLPGNQTAGLLLLRACQQGRHERLLEAALELVDAKKT
ncbi:hypothetical protein [Marinospirillum perlucidum]|uniref:hypothetical protein n=1 Tax=Marinospirillum perlucidum TaxID=1982602 RepID=UPI000DF41706|nr:hypothetical protein [Marinospirillum perlucidum]